MYGPRRPPPFRMGQDGEGSPIEGARVALPGGAAVYFIQPEVNRITVLTRRSPVAWLTPEKIRIVGVGEDGLAGVSRAARKSVRGGGPAPRRRLAWVSVPEAGGRRLEVGLDLDQAVGEVAAATEEKIVVLASATRCFTGWPATSATGWARNGSRSRRTSAPCSSPSLASRKAGTKPTSPTSPPSPLDRVAEKRVPPPRSACSPRKRSARPGRQGAARPPHRLLHRLRLREPRLSG